MKESIIRQKPLELLIHVISWLLIFGFPLILMDQGNQVDWLQFLRHSLVPLCYFIVFYLNYLWFVPHYLCDGHTRSFLILNSILILLLSSGLHFGQDVLFPPPPQGMTIDMPRPPHWIFQMRDLIVMIFVAGLSTAIRVSLKWRETEEKLNEAEREKTEAELKNLKNQLNPHFLLNTLNNIYALIAFNKDKAQEAVQELGRLLRHMLYDNQATFVTLEKELDFVSNYISLMRIRVSENVKISVSLNPGKKTLEISPLIFISLIENAFKHGISPTEESFISIAIHGHSDGKVVCEIMNSNHPKNHGDKSGNGIGLEQVKRRLELVYSDRYEWRRGISADGSSYTSILTIQTKV